MSKSTPAQVEGKSCTKCREFKPASEYYVTRGGRSLASRCKPCTRDDLRESYRRRSDRTGRPRVPEPIPVTDGQKRCVACGENKPLDQFHRHGRGYRRECKACRLAGQRARRQDPEFRSAWLARRKAHYHANRDDIRKAATKWRKIREAADPERARAQRRAYYLAHREKQYESAARWRATNIERHRARAREWAARHRAANPERVREVGRRAMSRRRAHLRGLPCEPYTMEELLERDGTDCVLCGRPLNMAVQYPHPMAPTIEHLECLSWPGASAGDTKSNTAVAHFFCNTSRRDRPHPAAARKRAELLAAEQAVS